MVYREHNPLAWAVVDYVSSRHCWPFDVHVFYNSVAHVATLSQLQSATVVFGAALSLGVLSFGERSIQLLSLCDNTEFGPAL